MDLVIKRFHCIRNIARAPFFYLQNNDIGLRLNTVPSILYIYLQMYRKATNVITCIQTKDIKIMRS